MVEVISEPLFPDDPVIEAPAQQAPAQQAPADQFDDQGRLMVTIRPPSSLPLPKACILVMF